MSARSIMKHAARAAVTGFIAVAFAACTTAPSGPGIDMQALERRAIAAAEAGDQRTAANLFVQLANNASGTQRAGYLLDATRYEIELNNLLTARELLVIAQPIAAGQQIEFSALLLARIELAEGRAGDALARVQPLLASTNTPIRTDALAVTGDAQFALGRPVAAIENLSEREVWLDDVDQILANQRTIWLNLVGVRADLPQTGDEIVDGWLALASASRMADAEEQRSALLQWRISHLQHPAARVLLRDIIPLGSDAAGGPQQIALLLPISSGARNAASAIRDGFIAAHMLASNERSFASGNAGGAAPSNELTVRVYDTATEGAEAAYLRAETDGADFIIGPLLRNAVENILPQSGFVPTLTLNHTLTDEEVFGNTYQFALAPEDEAIAVALRAISLEQRRAVVLVPSNDRGYRIYNSFRETYEAYGGEILDFMGYDDQIGTYGQRIRTLLNLDRSNARERTLQANLREDVTFEPRRRQDIDMVFLIGSAAEGRQLAPQLEFLYAGDIPTYAISDIHDLNSRNRESDLNRIMFPQVPWLIAPDADALRLQQTLAARWPDRNIPMARFFAMGVDSYRIMNTLYRDPFFTSVEGATGLLRMDTQGRIHRDLPFAQYRGGVVEPLEDTLPVQPEQLPPAQSTLPEPIDASMEPIDTSMPPRTGISEPLEPFSGGE